MHNWPNITPFEVAVVCTAALLLCIMPNLLAVADVRRRRRQQRAAAEESVMQRRATEMAESSVSQGTTATTATAATAETVPTDSVTEASAPATEATTAAASLPESAPATPPASVAPHVTEVAAALQHEVADPAPAQVARATAWPESTEEPTVCTLRLEDLRRVKLPNWPPAEVRDNPERKRLWEEAVRVAEQPLLTAMAVDSPRRAESACLGSAESDGSVLRLHFFLFSDLWPVAAEQATSEALFEVDSAAGSVRARVRSLS